MSLQKNFKPRIVSTHRGESMEVLIFNRNWDAYKNGFGDMDGSFWLGNEFVYNITNVKLKLKYPRNILLLFVYSRYAPCPSGKDEDLSVDLYS